MNLCAGDFIQIKNDGVIPMSIFVSHSKENQLDAKEMFRVVTIGIAYYEELFGVKFPFAKYDQIFCPEFRISAMENVGAITFADRLLKPKDEETNFNKSFRTFVVLHELAHMWFGDLVTMRWWNDLWLKESFADFCALVCQTESELSKTYPESE